MSTVEIENAPPMHKNLHVLFENRLMIAFPIVNEQQDDIHVHFLFENQSIAAFPIVNEHHDDINLHFLFENRQMIDFDRGTNRKSIADQSQINRRYTWAGGRRAGPAEVLPYPMAGKLFPSTTSSHAGADPN